jgi:hypothetical protein
MLSAACASASVLPGLADTVQIREWLVCGPFSVGTREGITGVVEDPLTFRPSQGDTFRSGLVQGGVTTWGISGTRYSFHAEARQGRTDIYVHRQ